MGRQMKVRSHADPQRALAEPARSDGCREITGQL